MNKKRPKHSSQHRDWSHHGRTTRAGEDKKVVWPLSIWRPAERLQGMESLTGAFNGDCSDARHQI
jgi:hypothetical protein